MAKTKKRLLIFLPILLAIAAGWIIFRFAIPRYLDNAFALHCIDKNGKEIEPPPLDVAPEFAENLRAFFAEHEIPLSKLKNIIFEKNGRVVLLKYHSLEGGPFPLTFRGDLYYIGRDGKVACKVSPGVVGMDFSEGLAAVATSFTGDLNSQFTPTRWGYVDTTGTFLVPPVYESASSFSEGLAAVHTGKGAGFIDKTGRLVIPDTFAGVRSFSEGLAAAAVNDKNNPHEFRWGCIDKTGAFLIQPQYKRALTFHDGLARLDGNDMCTFIDKAGRVVFTIQCDPALDFSEGLAAARTVDNKWGFIDKMGNFQIPAQFEGALSFHNGAAFVIHAPRFARCLAHLSGALRTVF